MEVRRRSGCLPLRSSASGGFPGLGMHIARASRELDHCRALCAAIHGQPRDRKRQRAHTWTRTVEADLKPANIGLLSAWRRAQDQTAWSVLIRTVMPQSSFAPDDDNDDDDDGDDDDGGGGGGGSGGGVIYRFIINRDWCLLSSIT